MLELSGESCNCISCFIADGNVGQSKWNYLVLFEPEHSCPAHQANNTDVDLTMFATEASKFVTNFKEPISCSVPHIYISALPFIPQGSRLKQMQQQFPCLLAIQNEIQVAWPAQLKIMDEHTQGVTSTAFSPDGKHIASGSVDNTIRVWDVQSVYVVAGPFEGHTQEVTSVAFSPDGKHIASGSNDNTIRVWDVQSGNVVAGPFEGHTQGVRSVAFSPDGKHIASGSNDNTIRVWDVQSGNVVAGPFEGHTQGVRSVAFS